MAHKKNLALGVLFSLFAYFCLSITNTLVKIIDNRVHSFQILLLQFTFALLLMFLLCVYTRKTLSFYKSNHYGLLFVRAISGIGAFFFVFISIRYLSVANATLFLNTAPFFIPFVLLLYVKEPIDHRLWLGIIPGFIGIVLILRPTAHGFNWHAILPLASGISVAIIYLSVGRLHHYKEPMLRILFYLYLFAAILVLPFGLFYWQNPSTKDWLLLGCICITSFLAQTALTFSLRHGSPKALAPLCYTSVVFALFFDWLIWNHTPHWLSAIGILLVLGGGIFALILENQSPHKL